jgi:hypothetical protein
MTTPLQLDKKRYRVKFCPCGKRNKDGKFVPFKGYEDKGYCHSCGETFTPPFIFENKCFLIRFDKQTEYSPKSYCITQNARNYYLPKSQVHDITENSCYVSEWFLTSSLMKDVPQYIAGDYKMIIVNENSNPSIRKPEHEKPKSFIPNEPFKASLKVNDTNHFFKFLVGLFGVDITTNLVSRYFIGTSKFWSGATVFWQIDAGGNIRTGKIMLYNPDTGKRVKEPRSYIAWVHSALKLPEFELNQCFFGEHLLRDSTKPVAIVESEKTAIIASIYLPQFIWLACGSKEGLNVEKSQILKGRNVTLFPDLKAHEKWREKAKQLAHIARFNVSDLLETKATPDEMQLGLDLADYLIRFDYREFLEPDSPGKGSNLKELFKAEFLKETELPPEMQLSVWQSYNERGLSAVDAKAVLTDLSDNFGFEYVD